MKKLLIVLALAATAVACGDTAEQGPSEEEMKAAVSKLLEVPEEKITEFKKGECKTRDEGYVCTFDMSITFTDKPSPQALNRGYFFKSNEEWVMDLV